MQTVFFEKDQVASELPQGYRTTLYSNYRSLQECGKPSNEYPYGRWPIIQIKRQLTVSCFIDEDEFEYIQVDVDLSGKYFLVFTRNDMFGDPISYVDIEEHVRFEDAYRSAAIIACAIMTKKLIYLRY